MHPSKALAALTLGLAVAPLAAQAGPRRPTPDALVTRSCRLDVDIVDGVATLRLALVVHNPGGRIAEADWILPLPEQAVADHLTLTLNGQEVAGEVLDAGRARGVYESIVRRRRDPALLEHVGAGALRARLFPIPAQGDAKIEIGWRQVLPELADLVRWTFPVRTCGVDGTTPGQVELDLSIESSRPLRNAFSPTPGVEVVRRDDRSIRASFEGPGAALGHEPLAVYYGLSESEFGLHALTWRKGDDPGHFLMLVSPKRSWDDAKVLDRSITLVIDASGSMQGEKIEQAKAACRQFVTALRPSDRFNVVPFATDAEPFFPAPVAANAENVAAAVARIATIEARGGTNIAQALRGGAPDRGPDGEHVPIVVFVTDGRATVEVKDPDQLAAIAKDAVAPTGARIFVLGVGNDLDSVLLDRLSAVTRGTRQYVRPGENLEEHAAELFTRLSHPVMTDLELHVEDAVIERMVPARLPDLFAGSRLMVVGRYTKPGHHAIRLVGKVQGTRREYVYEADFTAASTQHDFVPAFWAERRVATLLDAIRQHGEDQELVAEVRRLGEEYRIVTPYTSHLVVEPGAGPLHLGGPPRPSGPWQPGPGGPSTPGPAGPATAGPAGPTTGGGRTEAPAEFFLGAGGGGAARNGARLKALGERLRAMGVVAADASDDELDAKVTEVAEELARTAAAMRGLRERSGEAAVDASVMLARMLQGERKAQSKLLDLFSRRIGDKVFLLRSGVWTDRAYDAKTMGEKTRRVAAFGDAYFALLAEHPELRQYVSFATRVLVVLDDLVVEVVEAAPEPQPKDGEQPTGQTTRNAERR